MAELHKGTSTSAKPKEKSSDLDEEAGKDFFSSWKSMSVADDDLNFSFDKVDRAPKGKKKAFNFDKLDMEFNLDGDFGKLDSFKIDMPDLDFTSPHKKPSNSKEKSQDEDSAGKRPKKPGSFQYSFDFDELDDLNFSSSLMKGGKTNKKELGGKGMASDDCEAAEKELTKGIDSFGDGIITELQVKENPANTTIDTSTSSQEEHNLMSRSNSNKEDSGHSCPSDSVAAKASVLSPSQKTDDSNGIESDQPGSALENSHSMSHGPKDPLHRIESNTPKEPDIQSLSSEGQLGQKIYEQKIETNIDEINQTVPSEENPVSSDLFNQHEFHGSAAHSISENDLSQESAADMLAEFCSQTRKVDPSSVAEENTDMNMTFVERSTHSEFQAKNSSMEPESAGVHLMDSGDSISSEASPQNDPDQESNPVVSREMLRSTKAPKNTENSSLKLLSVSDRLRGLGQQATVSPTDCTDPKLAVTSAQSAQICKVDSGMNKVVKNSAELPRLQLPRIRNAKPLLSGCGENETDSLTKLDQIKHLSGTTSKFVHVASNTENRSRSTSSLKRKIKESNADLLPLNPFKRLAEHPRESGKDGEPSEQFADKQGPNPEQMDDSEIGYASIVDDHPISEARVSWTVDATETESSLPLEDDGIAESAEKYIKGLEEICNMLRQKEEEAKELMVRAVVNNNNLLMLNHPIYDEELRIVQEFAELLISKEL